MSCWYSFCWCRSLISLTQCDKFPLHLAIENHARPEVVAALLLAYPDAENLDGEVISRADVGRGVYSPFPKRWDSKWSSKRKSESWIIFLVFIKCSMWTVTYNFFVHDPAVCSGDQFWSHLHENELYCLRASCMRMWGIHMYVYMYAIFLRALILVRTAIPLHTQPHTHAHTHTYILEHTHMQMLWLWQEEELQGKITGDLLALPVNKAAQPTSSVTFFSFSLLKIALIYLQKKLASLCVVPLTYFSSPHVFFFLHYVRRSLVTSFVAKQQLHLCKYI